jgi:hypothetical protein
MPRDGGPNGSVAEILLGPVEGRFGRGSPCACLLDLRGSRLYSGFEQLLLIA